MKTTIEEIQKELDIIRRRIKTAQTNALRFYDDGAEVAIQYQIIDELLLDEAALIEELHLLRQNEDADKAWDSQNIFEK